MNHETPSPAVKPTLLTPSAMDYTPIKEGQTPGKGHQSAQLYYFGQNRTPLNRIQQISGLRGDSQPLQGSQLKTPNSGCTGKKGNSYAFHNSRTPSSTRSGKVLWWSDSTHRCPVTIAILSVKAYFCFFFSSG